MQPLFKNKNIDQKQKQNIDQPYDSAISFMGTYLEKTKTTNWKNKYIAGLCYNSKAVGKNLRVHQQING